MRVEGAVPDRISLLALSLALIHINMMRIVGEIGEVKAGEGTICSQHWAECLVQIHCFTRGDRNRSSRGDDNME